MAAEEQRAPFAPLGGRDPATLFAGLPTPAYVLDEAQLRKNGEIMAGVASRTGARFLLAQKAFSNYDLYPVIEPYMAGTEASGLYEARLGKEEMPSKEVHVFCAAYRDDEFDESEHKSNLEAMSDAEREEVEEALAEAMEFEQLKTSEEMVEVIEEILTEQNINKDVDIDFTSQYVQLTLNGALLFDSGSAQIKSNALPILDKIGVILQKYSDSEIEIEGHTDNVPISGRYSSNNELSSARALSVFEYLMDKTTLDPAMVKHSGRGEYIPVADNSTPEGRTQNRRVEIKIYHTVSTD